MLDTSMLQRRVSAKQVLALSLAALAATAFGAGAESLPASGTGQAGSVTLRPAGSVHHAPLGYIEYLPRGYEDGKKRPLLTFLHGAGEAGNGSASQLRRVWKLGIPNLIRKHKWPGARPFVVLMPQYTVAASEECLLADEVDSFLKFAVEHYAIDKRRVYITGVSCGGIGGWHYLSSHLDELIAGAALVSAHAVDAVARAGCRLARVPIWAFHGAKDEIVPKQYIARPFAKLKACAGVAPANLRLTMYPRADHDAWTPTYRRTDLYAWLLRHRHP